MAPTRVEQVATSAISPHPNNVRRALGDLKELADSIKAKGLLQPLVVAPNGKPGKYILIAGHRRLAAAKSAGVKDVTVVVREDLDTEASQLEAMLVENLHRSDLTVLEEGDAYEQLLAFDGYDVKTLSAKTGRAQKTIRERVAVAKLPDKVRTGVGDGQITIERALVLAEFADDPDTVDQLTKEIGSWNWDWAVRRARDARKARKNAEQNRKKLEKAGVRIVSVVDLDEAEQDWCEVTDLADDILEEGTYEALGQDDAAYAAALLDAHSHCPGHAADLEGHTGEPFYVCTKPSEHGYTDSTMIGGRRGATGPTPEEQQEADEARKAQEKLRADVDTATKVRREHLAEKIAEGDEDTAWRVALESVLTVAGVTWARETRLPLLGLPVDANEKQVEARLTRMSLAELVIAHRLLSAVTSTDSHLERPSGFTADWTKEWRDELENLWDYKWSDVEATLICGGTPA